VVGHLNGRTATAKIHAATIVTAIVPAATDGLDIVLFAHVHAGTGKDNEHVPTPNRPEDVSELRSRSNNKTDDKQRNSNDRIGEANWRGTTTVGSRGSEEVQIQTFHDYSTERKKERKIMNE